MPPPRSLNFVFLTHILASGGSNNTSCQVGGVFVAYRQPSVVGGLLISGLLVIPCISAGTLAISVGSKVILSNFLWFHDDNISVTLLFFGCSHQSHPTMPRIEQCLHPEFLFIPEYDKVISDALPSFSQSW